MQRLRKNYGWMLLCQLLLVTACTSEPENRKTGVTPPPAAEQSQVNEPARDLVIGNGRAGEIFLGMEVEKALSRYPANRLRKQEILLEGVPYPQYVLLDLDGKPELVLEPRCTDSCRIYRISVLSTAYHTPEKLGVGSTVAELRKAYPSREVFVEEGNVVIRIEKAGLSFLLNPADVPQDWFVQPEPNNLPAKAKVIRLLLTGAQPVKSTKM